jgi:DNA invertase Pin-like site-specific DNA recombinase
VNTRHLRAEQLRGLRWRGYIRESTAAQAEKWSPERQRADIERAAGELGLTPDPDQMWYEAVGSGEATSDVLAIALADARAGAYDVLMVLTTSRFARNRSEAVRMKAEFARTHTVIYFVAERIVSGARQTALLEGIKEVVDAEENEVRRMWIAGGHRERMLSGRWLGAIPVGYRKAMVDFPDGTRGWDGGLEPDPDTAAVVRAIFDRFASGCETRDIALQLNGEGHRSQRGPWSRAQVVKVLRNPVYAGRLVRYRDHREGHYYTESDEQDGRREIEGSWEPLVDAADFEQVQKLLAERAAVASRASGRRRYPMSVALRCGECGHRFSGVSNGYTRYYRCSKRAADGSCDARSIRADEAEGAFASILDLMRLPLDWREAIAATVEPVPDTSGRPRLEARLAALRDLYSWGDIDEATYRTQRDEAAAQLALLARPAPRSIEDLVKGLTRVGAHWANASPEQQSRLVNAMLRAAIVKDGRLVALLVRAEVRPLVELCIPEDRRLSAASVNYTADGPRIEFG